MQNIKNDYTVQDEADLSQHVSSAIANVRFRRLGYTRAEIDSQMEREFHRDELEILDGASNARAARKNNDAILANVRAEYDAEIAKSQPDLKRAARLVAIINNLSGQVRARTR